MSGLFEERVPNREIGNAEVKCQACLKSAFPIRRLGTRRARSQSGDWERGG